MSLWDLPPARPGRAAVPDDRAPAPAPPPTTPTSSRPSLVLAVTAPAGPPAARGRASSTASTRPGSNAAWATATPARLAAVRAAARHLGDIQLRYATLLGRLGPALDGPGTLADADAWYFILEGTREPSVAEAQALALTELVARAATSPGAEPPRRSCSPPTTTRAVSRRVPLSQPVRARPVPRHRRAGLRPVLAGTRHR